MNTEALEYFNKVYEKKSLTAAAKELFITPQGVSKTIKQLETELEVELFARGPRGMETTEAGELLYARSRHILYLLDDIKQEINILSGRKGTLDVLITYSASLLFPVEKLYRFSERYSDIHLRIKEVPDEYPDNQTFYEKADVGLIIGPVEFQDCEFELVQKGQCVLVVSNAHHLAHKERISLSDLKDECFVIKESPIDTESYFVEQCLEKGFNPHIKHEYGNIQSAHRFSENENLISVSVDFVENIMDNSSLTVLDLEETIPQNIYLVARKRGFQAKAVNLFQQFIRSFY